MQLVKGPLVLYDCYISTLKLNDLLLNLFISYQKKHLKVPLNCNDFKRNPKFLEGLLPQTPLGGLPAPPNPPAVCTSPLRDFVFPRYARPHQFLGGSAAPEDILHIQYVYLQDEFVFKRIWNEKEVIQVFINISQFSMTFETAAKVLIKTVLKTSQNKRQG